MQLPVTMDLDDLDRAILDLYQRDTRQPSEQIGAQVGLSAAAVQRRLKRMRESGAIVAETAALDPRKLGLGLTAIVNVDLVDESARATRAFRDKVCARGEVQQCYGVAGSFDYVLLVVVADLQATKPSAKPACCTTRTCAASRPRSCSMLPSATGP